MRILGIDPGSRKLGFGIITQHGNTLTHVANGTIFTDTSTTLPLRLKTIVTDLHEVINEYRPDIMAIEQVFVSKNVMSALKLGQARGAAIAVSVEHNLDVYEYSALQVKSAVVGYGRADKHQVQHMVKILMSLSVALQEDAADALAIAICHAHSYSALKIPKG